MKKIHILKALALAALSAVAFAGCASASTSGGSAKKLTVLKIQADDWTYVAQSKGWFDETFKKDGVKVQLVQGTLGNEVQLFQRGDLDIASRMIYPTLLFKTQGADVKVVAVSTNPAPPITSVLVRADSPYKTFDDLKGKKIASFRTSCPYMVLFELAEDRNWVEGKDWHFINTPSSTFKNALLSNQVDAVVWHPTADMASLLVSGQAREIANPAADSMYIQGGGSVVNFTPSAFAKNYPDIIKKYLKLQLSTEQWMLKNKDTAADLILKTTRVPVNVSEFSWDRLSSTWAGYTTDYATALTNTQRMQDWLIAHGDVQKSKQVDLSTFFDKQYFNF